MQYRTGVQYSNVLSTPNKKKEAVPSVLHRVHLDQRGQYKHLHRREEVERMEKKSRGRRRERERKGKRETDRQTERESERERKRREDERKKRCTKRDVRGKVRIIIYLFLFFPFDHFILSLLLWTLLLSISKFYSSPSS